jgi:beta-mannosidase
VHTDLLRNAKIPAPFYGTNEKELQWIDKRDWEYETEFDIPEELLLQERIELELDGLDTYADVSLNGQPLLAADNMFRSWTVDAKPLLRAGENRLHIRFRSPIQEDLPKLEKLGYPLPASNDQSEVGELGERRVSIFSRKAPYHYGWDWGPRFVTSGIWKDIRLVAWSGIRLRDLYVRQNKITADAALLTVVIEAEATRDWEGLLRLQADGLQWEEAVRLQAGSQTVQLDITIDSPRLWWSRGLGEQARYTFTAVLLQGNEAIAEKSVKTGLRSIRLVREDDEHGTGFQFELNGFPIFAKGANHIPNDSFITEVSEERYRHEIASAVQSNMNMLRVWGGGVYESDLFYELCDEYGLLVWQDFIFACSMYPGDQAFLDSVRAEAEQQIKRLRNHPCLALWCGNNEIDTAWAHYDENHGWGWKKHYTPEQREEMWTSYKAVFHHILPSAIFELHGEVDYWPSSPLHSLSGDARQHARYDSASGDMHYWGVWHNLEPFDQYNRIIGRFMSEYGFQSFPERRTVLSYAEESDLYLESEVMLRHQKNGQGNQLIRQYMEKYLPEPKDFSSFLYMSHILQAEAMKTAIEAHRRRKFYCMGTLYWQMNDCWPVASWSSMDYYGRWKATQYYARRSFRDVLVSIDGTHEDRIDIHLISDLRDALSGTLELQLLDFSGRELQAWHQEVTLSGNAAERVRSFSRKELLEGRDPGAVLLLARFAQAGAVLDSKVHYFVSAKELVLPRPELRIARSDEDGRTSLTLETDSLAVQICLTAEQEGTFSDNFFDLLPGYPVTVEFYPRSAEGEPFVPGLAGSVEIRSMADYVK